jgi:hypothetical protein
MAMGTATCPHCSFVHKTGFGVRKTEKSDWKLGAGGTNWHDTICDDCGNSFYIVEK